MQKKFEVTHFLRKKFAKFLQNGKALGGRHCFVSGLANQFFAKVPTKLIFAIKFDAVITFFLKIAQAGWRAWDHLVSFICTLAISLGG